MFRCVLAVTLVLAVSLSVYAQEKKEKVPPVLNFKMKGIDGKMVDLSKYKGKVILFVNVASYCGNTDQYAPLENMYKKYKKSGLVIVGVPSNDFGKQEPGTDAEIAKFCQKEYGVSFPMLSKVVVRGKKQVPLYKFLTSKKTNPKFGGAVRWNFDKFLIGRDGSVVARFNPGADPMSKEVLDKIHKALEK